MPKTLSFYIALAIKAKGGWEKCQARNHLAYEITENIGNCKPWLELVGVDMTKLLKHTEQYEKTIFNKEKLSLASIVRQYKAFSKDAARSWVIAQKEATAKHLSVFDLNTDAGKTWQRNYHQREIKAQYAYCDEKGKVKWYVFRL